ASPLVSVETRPSAGAFRATSMSHYAILFSLPVLAFAARADDLQTVTITTPPGQMKYDHPVIKAPPGSQMKIIFQNNDEMPHNIVFCLPKTDGNDKGMDVAMEAWKLAEKGEARGWIPEHSRIWAHSDLVAAHKKQEITLKVPDQPGVYPYVCTFPGHAMAMNGELRVLAEGPGFQSLNFKLFMGDWVKMPDFATLKPHREGPMEGKKLDLKLEGMSEHFGVQFEGVIEPLEEGNYQFTLASDDGSRLFVDGRQVINDDGIHPSSDLKTGRIKLNKGPHTVRVDYFEQTGQEEIYLGWSGPKFSETPLSKWVHPSRKNGGDIRAEEQRNRGIPIGPENGEAVVYRNSISGCSPRGIAVGYPNGVNVCFDADQMTQALMWRGAFIDARQHWTDRGGGDTQPLGFNIIRTAGEGQGMAVLATAEAPWPTRKERAEGIDFLGYRLDKQRFPTFRYKMGDLQVEERYEPAGDYKTSDERVTRVLKFKGNAPAGLYVRAATGNMKPEGSGWKNDKGYTVAVTGGEATLRRNNELLVRPSFTNGTAEVRIACTWLNQ
ncbi:MAG TPA: PA14 domain-containing protein, partial [Verrucomicrobiales bacterium]|nr:PA14 domain-containing protein [Verrucomicrobiales bacterium]